MRDHGKVDIWQANDNDYYAQILPERRKLAQKEEPLAIMPAQYTDDAPYDAFEFGSENKSSNRNVNIPIPGVDFGPPYSRRQEVIDKINKKKNMFGPVNPDEVSLPAWSKKRGIVLKPGLDTGIDKDSIEFKQVVK